MENDSVFTDYATHIEKRLGVVEEDARTLARMVEQRDEWLQIAEEKIQARNGVIKGLNGEIIRLKTEREYWKDFTFKILKVLSK